MTAEFDAPTPPSERFRARLLEALLPIAAEQGWTASALKDAAAVAGLDAGEVQLAAPRGVLSMIDAFAEWADQQMLDALAAMDLPSMRIRDRVRAAVLARFEALVAFKAAEAKAVQALLRPLRAQEAPKIAWRTADHIWRALGDRSTDENYYSKRGILSGVLASTMARWLLDDDPGMAATKDFLDRRIENVMAFEKAKAQAAPLVATAGFLAGQAAQFVLGGRRAS
jgi:ubiquinone biosynthesis protein COQ9